MAASESTAVAATESPVSTAPVERTLALIKPDACGRPWMEDVMKKVEEETDDGPVERWEQGQEERAPDKAAEIIKRIQSSGFTIAKQLTRRLTKGQAEAFYAEHRGKPFFDGLTTFMSSGPIVSLVLEREMAITGWRALMGATNTLKARKEAEAANPLDETKWALRALFGTDGTRNATHGSDSPFSALREEEFFFPQKPVWERSVLVLLPDAADKEAEIVERLSEHEFVPIARTQRTLTAEQAEALCGAGSPAAAAAAAQAGECVVLVVERDCAVRQLYLTVGPPEGKASAMDKVPGSLNAVYGPGAEDGDGVAALAPATREAAESLIESLFDGPLPVEHTLAVIKPGTADEHREAIVNEITRHGFTIAAETREVLAKEQAEAFYEEHRGRFFFGRLTSYMASGAVVAMVLAKPGAIRSWRSLMGPTSTEKARFEAPNSLRARFGVDGTRNATHGSDSPASAAREIRFYFPDFAPHTLPDEAEASAFVAKKAVATVYNPVENNSISATLRTVLVQAMTAIAKEQAELGAGAEGVSESKGDEDAATAEAADPLETIRSLGQWLVDNNPRRGKAAESAAEASFPRGAHHSSSEATDEEAAAAAAAAAASSGAGGHADAGPSVEEISTELHGAGAVHGAVHGAGGDSSGRAIVFVLGAPGSGKGTQCARIKEEFGYVHLSTGDLLRAEVASGSELGREMEETMRVGGLVSLGTVLHLLRKAMDASGSKKFLIDGYPRSMKQAFAFEQAVGKPTMVLSFGAEEATLEARLVKRGETSGRADDNVESIRKRFATFTEESAPVIDFYGHVGLVRAVGTEGRTPDEVYAEVRKHFLPQFACVLGGPASGRSTLCRRAAAELGWTHVSTGELLRAEASLGTELGTTVATLLERGDLVPADVMLRVLQSALARDEQGTGRFLLDGYPRTAEQMAMMEKALGRPSRVVLCSAPDDVMRKRAKRRGAEGGRRDASASAIEHQLSTFHDKTSAVLDQYEKQALLQRVDTNRSPEQAFADFRKALMPQVVFVLGGPGSGKGTQCARLVEEFGFVHLSAGDLLRAERARGSPDGEMIEGHIRAGTIVPVSVTLKLLRDAMLASGAERLLIDGFPRAMDQAEGYEELLGLPTGVLFFDCPEATMRSRLLERGKTSGRSDDNEETIMKRFVTFQEQTMPVVRRYARSGLVMPVDATAPVEDVYAETRSHFLPQVVFVLGGPGSGKGTQCTRIKEEFGYVHLSMGDLLRAEVASGSELGREMEETMREGGLVPTDTTVVLLREAMRRSPGNRFLIDGFPRAREQSEAFERLVGQPKFVLFFDCPEATMRSRLLERGKTSGRADDNEEAIMKRFVTFQEQSLPAITDYKGRGLLREVSAVPSKDAVYQVVRKLFQPELVVMCGASGSGRGEFTSRAGLQLGYHTLRVPKLLAEEAKRDTSRAATVRRALGMHRTCPLDATIQVLREAMARSAATRFILDGFPRLTSEGFPSVHDQVFALEETVGPVRGCVCLDAHLAQRKARIRGVPTAGQEAALARSVNAFKREKLPVVAYFEAIGKTRVVDTTPAPDEVFQAAAPFLE